MSKLSSKVISKDTPSEYQPWNAPDVGFGGRQMGAKAPSSRQLSPEVYERIRIEAHQEGFAQGLAAGQAEATRQAQCLQQLMQKLSKPFEQMDDQIEKELVDLAIMLARSLIRRELKENPEEIMAVVREAMATLPVASRNVQLHLHPDDGQTIRNALSFDSEDTPWKLVEDISITRGGCRVITESSTVDATLETRLTGLITQMLGGDRADDHGHYSED